MPMNDLVRALSLASVLFAAPALAAQPDPSPIEFRVTLLGTGTPVPIPTRCSQSTLVQAGGHNLLFDFGRGAAIRLTQVGVPLGTIDASFITHMHSDHLSGLTDVWGTGWLPTAFGGRKTPMPT